MPDSATDGSSEHISYAVKAAGRLMHDTDSTARLDAHCRWELDQIFGHIRLSDLTSAEVMALLAVLAPVHSRVLSGQPVTDKPVLTLLH